MKTEATTQPLWKSAETICAIIEKAVSPGARVEHNVWLPVIGSKRKRQCDVVITYGEPPRERKAIVEVQKRNRRPDITTFHGWCEKMRRVGAHELLCVSAKGFPKSIIEEVRDRIGPTVRLLTLENVAEDRKVGGLFAVPWGIHVSRTFTLNPSGEISLVTSTALGGVEIRTDEKIFSVGDSTDTLSLADVVARILTNSRDERLVLPSYSNVERVPVTIKFDRSHKLYLHVGNERLLVGDWTIDVEVTFTRRKFDVDVSNMSYRQEFENGILVWVCTARALVEGKLEEICLTAKPNSEGFLTIFGIRRQLPSPA